MADMINTYESIAKKVFKNEEVLLCVPFDISKNGKYTDGFTAFSKTRMALFENNRIIRMYCISDLSEVLCAEYNGCGFIEAKIGGVTQCLVRFTMTYMEDYGVASELIRDINSGAEALKIKTENKSICPKCGRPFINNTKICRHCADKFSMIKRLWNLSKPCRPLYALLLVYFWVSSAVTVITPMLSKHLVNDVLTFAGKRIDRLIFLVGLMLLCSVITSIVEALRSVAASKASNLFVRDLRNEIYLHLQKLNLSYIEQKKTGDLMQRINSDTRIIQNFIQDIGIMAVNEAFLFVAIAVVTFSINVKMALLIFVPLPLACFIIYKIRSSIQRRYRKQWRKMDVLISRLNDSLNGIKVVKVFGREKDEINRFRHSAETVRDITSKNEKYVYTIFPIIRFLMGFGSFLVLLYGGSCVIGGRLTLGELVQFSSYGSYLYSKLEWFSMLPRHISLCVASAQRVFEVLDEKYPENLYNKDSSDIRGKFEFKNMSFGYKNYISVLKNINETVNEGEMVGLVGHSGAGKSTMINLIMQLYTPTRGKLLLDGELLDSYNPEEYKKNIGVVLQESYLFSGSVLDNIRYAVPEASIEECIEASKIANAHDFIMELPDAYNTYVGEKGYKLSGGERQRIAIARAILSQPKILILDEATASVDSETEEKIQESLSLITKGRTVFAIAHRLSTLKSAHRIIVLEEGRIAEEGTHKALLKKNGIYASLLRAQIEMTRGAVTIDNIEKKDEYKVEITEFENQKGED